MTATWFARVLAINFLLALIVHGVRPIVSYKALALDAGPTTIGLIVASFAALSFLIAVPVGRWVDRVGEAGCLIAGTVVTMLAALGLAVTENLVLLGLGMLALGAGHIIASVGVQTLIANGGDPQAMDSRFATQTVTTSIGQFAGPGLAGLMVAYAAGGARHVSAAATGGVFWAAGCAAAFAFVVAITLWRWPPVVHARYGRLPSATERKRGMLGTVVSVLRIPTMPRAILVGMAALSTVDVIVGYLPVYGVAHGIPVETIGLLLAVRGLSSIAGRVLMLPLRRAFGRRRILIGSLVLPGLALLLLPFFGSQIGLLYLMMALTGIGLGLCQPLTVSWMASKAPTDMRGAAVGLRLSANRLGQFALPTTVGLLASGAGVSAIFVALAVLLFAAAALINRRTFE